MDTSILSSETLRFSEAVRDCFRDMLGVESLVDGDSYKESSFTPTRRVLAMLHFTGPVEGDFVLGVEEGGRGRIARRGALPRSSGLREFHSFA